MLEYIFSQVIYYLYVVDLPSQYYIKTTDVLIFYKWILKYFAK